MNCLRDREHFTVRLNVVYPEQSSPPLVGEHRGGYRAEETASGSIGAENLAKEALARGPDEHGKAELYKCV
jgi:hypothetical protein